MQLHMWEMQSFFLQEPKVIHRNQELFEIDWRRRFNVFWGLSNPPDFYPMYPILLVLFLAQRSGILFVLPDKASMIDISCIVSTKDNFLSSLPISVSATGISNEFHTSALVYSVSSR